MGNYTKATKSRYPACKEAPETICLRKDNAQGCEGCDGEYQWDFEPCDNVEGGECVHYKTLCGECEHYSFPDGSKPSGSMVAVLKIENDRLRSDNAELVKRLEESVKAMELALNDPLVIHHEHWGETIYHASNAIDKAKGE